MPFIPEPKTSDRDFGLTGLRIPEDKNENPGLPKNTPTPTLGETVAAASQNSTLLAPIFTPDTGITEFFGTRLDTELDKDYDPFAKLKGSDIPSEYWDSFLFVNNEKEFHLMRQGS